MRLRKAIVCVLWMPIIYFFLCLALKDSGSTKSQTAEIISLNSRSNTGDTAFADIQIGESKDKKGMVLLLAYIRSGSSFVADILKQNSDTIYLFEPFSYYLPGFYYKMQSVCHIGPGNCRKPLLRQENSSFAVEVLQNIFECKVLDYAKEEILKATAGRSSIYRDFNYCIKVKKNQTFCLLELKRKCEQSSRIVKTIRISAELVPDLLKKIPTLKIIHLIRDPRGVIVSREKVGFSKRNDIKEISGEICNRYTEDITMIRNMHISLRKKIKPVLYETIAENPIEAAKSIYSFIGFDFTPAIERNIFKTTNGGRDDGAYSTSRKNSTETANRWRFELTFEDITIVDDSCTEFYDIVGYNKIPSATELKNALFKTRKNTYNYGDYLRD